MQHTATVSMNERPVIKEQIKLAKHPNDKVRE
jgi:hypothetical protein